MKFRRYEKLPPSAEPMQTMVDAGMLTDPPEGLIPRGETIKCELIEKWTDDVLIGYMEAVS